MFDNCKGNYSVKLSTIIEKLGLTNLNPNINTKKILIRQTDINRPALQLAGFYDFFDNNRIQIIGNVEYSYIHQVYDDEGAASVERMFKVGIPCLVFCRNNRPCDAIIALGDKYGIPVLITDMTTSVFMAKIIHILTEELAPKISIHGVLVDVYGEGVLIIGESGIGKSEAALELLKRGHRLVADDVVEIKKIGEDVLSGRAPDITRYLIELRGIGIVDVKTLFGVESVKEQQNINLVIKLEEWDRDREYDRLGLEDQYTEFLGIKVVCHAIPIRPGRNLAIIVESAAVNHRQKQMGYNAAHELYRRVTGNLQKKNDDEDED